MHDLSSRLGCRAAGHGFWGCWVQLHVRLCILPRFCPRLLHNPDSVLAQICKALTMPSPDNYLGQSLFIAQVSEEGGGVELPSHGSKPESPGDLLTPRSPDWKGK